MTRFSGCAIILLCWSGCLWAQEDTTQISYLDIPLDQLRRIEIKSASKFSQKISEAPSVVSLITNDQIQQYGWVSMHQFVTKLPGFSPSQDYDRRTISSRGLFEGWNNNHLLLMVDGIPMNDNLYGSAYTWEVTPLIFTESVEIIRGPASALYGSNATNGVLSLNTIDPSDMEETGEVRFRIGNKNTRIYDLMVGAENDFASLLVAFNAYETDGNEYQSFDDTRDEFDNYLSTRREVNDNRSSQYFFTKISGKNRLKDISFQYHEQAWQFETGHGWLFLIPDQPESMKESRRLMALSYKPGWLDDKLRMEISSRFQRHNVDWNMRYYSDNSLQGFYPNGVTEYLKTGASDLFSRVQLGYDLSSQSSLLMGIEHTYFIYKGDEAHASNIDLNNTYGPNPNNQITPANAWFEFALNQPVNTIGVFGQYISSKWGGKIQATAGLRYDAQFFDYIDIYDEDQIKPKSFSQLNPRLGLVVLPTNSLRFKLLAGRSFRTPAPTEMFGANTYSLASNIGQLEPEIINTYEMVMDWKFHKHFDLRINGFLTDFENQIAYSVANANLSTNVYSLTTVGFESELLLHGRKFSGFFNFSRAFRLQEEILDNTIAEDNVLTWVPSTTSNLGIAYNTTHHYFSGVLHYQGEVLRRSSDITMATSTFRLDQVNDWVELDLKAAYRKFKFMELGVVVNNMLGTKGFLIKNNSYPFDYQRQGRTFLLDFKLIF